MKEFRFVLVSMLLLGMGSCATAPKLDLSTVDPAQPIPVVGILMYTPLSDDRQDQFFQNYGDGDWNNDPKKLEQLLDILCGTASRNWAAITTKVKNGTGLTLNGDEFREDLQNGNTDRLTAQQSKRAFDDRGQFFVWQGIGVEQGYGASISLIAREGGKIEPLRVELHKFDALDSTESKVTIASF